MMRESLLSKLEFDLGGVFGGSASIRRNQSNKAVSFKETRQSIEEDKQDIFMEKIATVQA